MSHVDAQPREVKVAPTCRGGFERGAPSKGPNHGHPRADDWTRRRLCHDLSRQGQQACFPQRNVRYCNGKARQDRRGQRISRQQCQWLHAPEQTSARQAGTQRQPGHVRSAASAGCIRTSHGRTHAETLSAPLCQPAGRSRDADVKQHGHARGDSYVAAVATGHSPAPAQRLAIYRVRRSDRHRAPARSRTGARGFESQWQAPFTDQRRRTHPLSGAGR